MKKLEFEIRSVERLPNDVSAKLDDILKDHMKELCLEEGAKIIGLTFRVAKPGLQAKPQMGNQQKLLEDDGA